MLAMLIIASIMGLPVITVTLCIHYRNIYKAVTVMKWSVTVIYHICITRAPNFMVGFLGQWFSKWGPGTPRGPWESSRGSPTFFQHAQEIMLNTTLIFILLRRQRWELLFNCKKCVIEMKDYWRFYICRYKQRKEKGLLKSVGEITAKQLKTKSEVEWEVQEVEAEEETPPGNCEWQPSIWCLWHRWPTTTTQTSAAHEYMIYMINSEKDWPIKTWPLCEVITVTKLFITVTTFHYRNTCCICTYLDGNE